MGLDCMLSFHSGINIRLKVGILLVIKKNTIIFFLIRKVNQDSFGFEDRKYKNIIFNKKMNISLVILVYTIKRLLLFIFNKKGK